MAEREILWTVTDPRGLDITLTDDVWFAILDKHPELGAFYDAVITTVREPDAIYFDPHSTALRTTGAKFYYYYRGGLLTGEFASAFTAVFVKIVVEQDQNQGYVQTSYPSREILPRLELEWKK
jgi:hypothetical protein